MARSADWLSQRNGWRELLELASLEASIGTLQVAWYQALFSRLKETSLYNMGLALRWNRRLPHDKITLIWACC
jgi:hypothetical protein